MTLDSSNISFSCRKMIDIIRDRNPELGKRIGAVASILIVDDDRSLANTFKLVLKSVGYNNVDIATTGYDALYLANRNNYDLVISDINLPDMLGDELVERLRVKNPTLDTIMMAGYSSFKDEVDKNKRGIKEVLMKPIPPEVLVSIVNKILFND